MNIKSKLWQILMLFFILITLNSFLNLTVIAVDNSIIIDVVPDKTYQEIKPGHIAIFHIEVENLGDQIIEVHCKLNNVSEGWSVLCFPDTLIESKNDGGENIKDLIIEVRSPSNLGYHHEQETISLTVQAYNFLDNEANEVKSVPVHLLVRSRGYIGEDSEFSFFNTGFFLLIILLIITLIAIVIIRKKYRVRHN